VTTQPHLTETEHLEEAWTSGNVLDAIRYQGRILTRALEVLPGRVAEAITAPMAQRIDRVYTVGCGDSYYAALASRLAFENFTDLPTEALPSMEFSRYVAPRVGSGALVMALSNSGRVSRTIESAQVASARGATTIGVTGRSKSGLAEASDVVLSQYIDTPDLPLTAGSLGLANYMATLLALYLSAIHIGRLRGSLSDAQADGLMVELAEQASAIEATVDANIEVAQRYAGAIASEPVLYVLGAGPSLASSYFGTAKFYEQPQYEAVPQQLEEWAHEQYFMVTEGTPVLFIAPPGASRDRSLELFEAAKLRGGSVAVIADHDDQGMRDAADYFFPVVGKVSEAFSPISYVVPIEMVANALETVPDRPARRPRREVDPAIEDDFEFRRIYGSHVVVDEGDSR
jgi:glucosamine 6-phosphate synthetase-like amidotransferase/phosphosugar isomerase protein